jgi:thiol:disulfide interchange protein DsbD
VTFRIFSNALAALALLLSALAPAGAQGIDPDDLLPVEQAFALTARLAAPDRIELRWEIAEGYYLYRHRLSVRDAQGFAPCPQASSTPMSFSEMSKPIAAS